jgi:putative SbcD/Mre11-related phosphoesterase
MSKVILRDGIELHGPGGAFVPEQRAMIVADVHAGYTAHLRARGYRVPVGDDPGLLDRVRGLMERTNARHLVVAGDLAHGVGSARGNERSPLARFLEALREFEVTVVVGNHDRKVATWLTERGARAVTELALGIHRVHHGDDAERVRALRDEAMANEGRVFVGHLHPAVYVSGDAGVGKLLPAFVSARGLVCLPALSPYAHGIDVRDPRMRGDLDAMAPGEDLGAACVVGDRAVALGIVARALK